MIPWGTFPFNDDLKRLAGQMDPADVQSYVNDMMKKFMPSQLNNPSNQHTDETHQGSTSGNDHNSELNARVFETFDDVFIRIDLPDDHAHQRIRIFYTSNQTIVENIHGDDKRHVITLPCLVKRKGAIAQCKDQILEIKIPKSIDLQYTEIDVSEKL